MPKLIPYIFFLVVLHISVVAFSQQPDEPVKDTLIAIPPMPSVSESDTVRFNLIGQQEPVAVRNVPKKHIDSLKSEDDYWYANMEPEKKKKQVAVDERPNQNGLFQKQWFRDLLWIIILCSFIGVVIWYLISSNIFIFRKAAKKILNDEDAEETTDDIFALNYDKEIAKSEEGKNYRMAVRLWYLSALKELADKGLIAYRHGKTNNDYVTQLYNSQYYRDFFRLTRNFEYTWYGQFDLSAEAYQMMRNDFSNFKNALR